MSMPELEKYGVWTYDDRQEWLRSNIVPDVRLVYGVNRGSAEILAERLAGLHPQDTYEVRDAYDTVVTVYGAARDERTRPTPSHRRSLGGRGR